MAHKLIKKALLGSGLLGLASRFRENSVAVVMYHSVMDDPLTHKHSLGGIIHSSKVFRGQMELLARDYVPVPLDDVLMFVRGKKQLPRRSVVITFDDGYRDNFELAMPILDQVGIPATFYVVVECIDQQKLPWPARLRYAFSTTKKKQWLRDAALELSLSTGDEREQAFLQASDQCAQLAGESQERFLGAVEADLEVSPPADSRQLMMDWDQVRGLLHGGHTVGSHTMTHPNMAHIGPGDLRTEFAESKQRLEKELKTRLVHFSYPCPALQPHWSEESVRISAEVGYETAVTTTTGTVKRQHNALTMRRILPTKNVEGLRWNLERGYLSSRSEPVAV